MDAFVIFVIFYNVNALPYRYEKESGVTEACPKQGENMIVNEKANRDLSCRSGDEKYNNSFACLRHTNSNAIE